MRLFAMLLLAAATACTGAPAPAPTPDAPTTDGATADGHDAGGTADAHGEGTEEPTAAADTDAAEGTGEAVTLTLEKFTEAAGKVRPMMDKAAAVEAVKPILGEPTSASDEELVWVGKTGASECKALKVQMMGAFTGTVSVDDSSCPGSSE